MLVIEDKRFAIDGMETTENRPPDLIEKGATFFDVPEVPADWEPPSAAIVYEPGTDTVQAPASTADED